MSKQLELDSSRKLPNWLHETGVSLAFTTYQAGKLFLIGLQPDGKLSVFERSFERSMGLYAHANSLYLATLYQIWRLENTLGKDEHYQGYDALYVPQMSCVTGDLDVHDLAVDSQEQVYFANTLFSCIAETSPTHSFHPVWKPDFISRLAAEDRCHLNGLTLRDNRPGYATAVAVSDVREGWREHRANGGIVMDIRNNRVIAEGLSMPHSPRWHQGSVWFLNSGQGELVKLDPETGTMESICFCPGYARGLAFIGDYAVIGLSRARENKTFAGLPLDGKLEDARVSARCGLQIVNLRTGDVEHSLTLEGIVSEIYDVAVLPGITRPMAIGLKNTEIHHMISVE